MTRDLQTGSTQELAGLADRSNVAVGVDGSEAGQRALHYAVGVARRTGARVVVVHVRRSLVTYDGMGPQGLVDSGALDSDVRAEIDEVTNACGVESVYVDLQAVGSTAPVLAAVADATRADALVVGASRRPLHRIAGSVGAQLIKTCGCPVTVVP